MSLWVLTSLTIGVLAKAVLLITTSALKIGGQNPMHSLKRLIMQPLLPRCF